jgi:hypothetical protein
MSSSPRPLRIALSNCLCCSARGAPGELVKGLGFRIMNSYFQKLPYCEVAKSSRRCGLVKNPLSGIYFEGFFYQFPDSLFKIFKVRGRYVFYRAPPRFRMFRRNRSDPSSLTRRVHTIYSPVRPRVGTNMPCNSALSSSSFPLRATDLAITRTSVMVFNLAYL